MVDSLQPGGHVLNVSQIALMAISMTFYWVPLSLPYKVEHVAVSAERDGMQHFLTYTNKKVRTEDSTRSGQKPLCKSRKIPQELTPT